MDEHECQDLNEVGSCDCEPGESYGPSDKCPRHGGRQRPRCYHCGKFMTDPQTESRRAERQVMRDFDRESRFHGGG